MEASFGIGPQTRGVAILKCPTCDAVMHPTNSTRDSWCEECGTFANGNVDVYVPKIVKILRKMTGIWSKPKQEESSP